MKTIYIAGKITGLPRGESLYKFYKAERQLRREGYKVTNPLKIVPEGADWPVAMKISLHAILDCDEVFMLRCWKKSKGARLEHDLAVTLKIKIRYEK